MSPSESDLRAALRAGESGERLDVDSVIAQARAARRTRRRNFAAITGAVIAVLAVTSNGVTSRRAGQLLNELAEGIVSSVTSPIPTVPNHSMSHGPGPS